MGGRLTEAHVAYAPRRQVDCQGADVGSSSIARIASADEDPAQHNDECGDGKANQERDVVRGERRRAGPLQRRSQHADAEQVLRQRECAV